VTKMSPRALTEVEIVARLHKTYKEAWYKAERDARRRIRPEIDKATASQREAVTAALLSARGFGATKLALQKVTTKDHSAFEALIAGRLPNEQFIPDGVFEPHFSWADDSLLVSLRAPKSMIYPAGRWLTGIFSIVAQSGTVEFAERLGSTGAQAVDAWLGSDPAHNQLALDWVGAHLDEAGGSGN
jgi:hypothetical protein